MKKILAVLNGITMLPVHHWEKRPAKFTNRKPYSLLAKIQGRQSKLPEYKMDCLN